MSDHQHTLGSYLLKPNEGYELERREAWAAYESLRAEVERLTKAVEDADCERMATAVAIVQSMESGELATLQAEVERLRLSRDGWKHDATIYAANANAFEEQLMAAEAELERLTPTDDELDGAYCLADGHQHRNRYAEAICSLRFQLATMREENERLTFQLEGEQENRAACHAFNAELNAENERLTEATVTLEHHKKMLLYVREAVIDRLPYFLDQQGYYLTTDEFDAVSNGIRDEVNVESNPASDLAAMRELAEMSVCPRCGGHEPAELAPFPSKLCDHPYHTLRKEAGL